MKFVPALVAVLLAFSSPAWAAPTHGKTVKAAAPAHVALPTNVAPERYDIMIQPDAEHLSFAGREAIAVVVRSATDRIVLNAADITFQKASLSDPARAPKTAPPEPGELRADGPDLNALTPKIVLDKDQQTAAFVFDRPLAPGRYVLSLDYTGVIYQQASGLFALDYVGDKGAKQRAIFTQFENSDARRFIPCWDEPGVKAVYALSIEAPAAEMPVSNMPVAASVKLSDGVQLTHFADTPKMSSYLLFFALGDFERAHRRVGATDVGVIVRRGKTAQAQFALDAASQLLPYYNDYFGTPFPLPKLDFIAGPGRSQFFAAMENWGAIYYFDYALLVDPKLTTEADKQNIYVDIAHEMAHQWFGDLVTMAWWDDLWLNEGFASWMENKATDHFHPEWKIWLQTKAGEQRAMRTDARAGTHPVIRPIHDVFAAATAFDGITYEKGHAVIHMLEDYVGPDVFRAGVRNYIAHHAYGNTVTDDLWTEIDRVSPKKIAGIAHDFTLQAGVPLISVSQKDVNLTLLQGRFSADAASKSSRKWRTPVALTGGGKPWKALVDGRTSVMNLARPRDTVLLNAGQTGYFRSRYSPALFARVAAGYANLRPEDQLGLIYDSEALGEAGYAPMPQFLTVARAAQSAADPEVLRTLAQRLSALDDIYHGQPGQAAYRAFARARLAQAYARVGWDASPGEADSVALLRRTLLPTLGKFDDPAVIAEARRRFTAWLAAPDSLKGTARQTVLQIVADHADAATWDRLHALGQKATDITDKSRFYRYLGASDDPALADRALALALTKDPSPTDAPELISSVARRFPEKAFGFALAHRAQVDALIEPTSRASFIAQLAARGRSKAILPQLQAYAATIPASTRGEVTKTVATITDRLEIVEKRLPEVDRWLAAHPG